MPGTQETGTPQTHLDRKIEQHRLALKLTEAKQNGALYFKLAHMADNRIGPAEVLRRYERSLAAFETMKETPEGAVPVVEQRRELSNKMKSAQFGVFATPPQVTRRWREKCGTQNCSLLETQPSRRTELSVRQLSSRVAYDRSLG